MTPFYGIRHGTEHGMSTQHNKHTRLVRGVVSRSVPMPAPRKWARPHDISSTPEPWQPLPRLVTHPHAAVPVTLHRLDLLRSQQGVGHELIGEEDGVVGAGHNCFGRPHALYGGSVRR